MGAERFHEGDGEPSRKPTRVSPRTRAVPRTLAVPEIPPSPMMSPAPKNQLWKARLVSPRRGLTLRPGEQSRGPAANTPTT